MMGAVKILVLGDGVDEVAIFARGLVVEDVVERAEPGGCVVAGDDPEAESATLGRASSPARDSSRPHAATGRHLPPSVCSR